ncbi:hypothetical protein sos41_05190 [Alphaproteobacteria bacterium SO-S41]|nr:hypothetical protein sos41_05190 [Alphaproteobacteria bacterium SO-S41]
MSLPFTKRLREPIKQGEITSSVRIWQTPRVRLGGRYQLDEGHVEVTGLQEIALGDITPALARAGGFAGVIDLLKIARHGAGNRVFLVTFVYQPPEG